MTQNNAENVKNNEKCFLVSIQLSAIATDPKLLPLSNASMAAKLATIDRARALPTLKVVLGSRFGGGGGWMDVRFGNFLGNVEYCLK